MKLSQLVVDQKSAWVEFPGFDGFEVEVSAYSRDQYSKLVKRCTKQEWNRRTNVPVEKLDEEKFVKEFSKTCIKGWRGLKLKYLDQLMLVDISQLNENDELPYSQDDAEVLVRQSKIFDEWLNEVVFDLDNFRSFPRGGDVEEAGEVV